MKLSWSVTLGIILAVSFTIAYFLYDKPESVDILHSKEFFAGILGASAGILAIAFSLSQYAISRISDTYSPYIIKHHNEDPITKVSFLCFLITTILSGVLLGVELSDIFSHQYLVYFTVIFFIFSLISFAKYFFGMISMLNPIQFASTLRKQSIQYLKNEDFVEFENIITSIGDTAIKSLERFETRICNQYLDELFEIGVIYLKLRSAFGSKIEDAGFNDSITQNPTHLVLHQFERIYKNAYAKDHQDVTLKVLHLSDDLLDKNLMENGNQVNVRFFMSIGTFESFFQRIQQITSKDRSGERVEKKVLARIIVHSIIQFTHPIKIKPEYVINLVPKPLFEIVQIIIDNRDLDSFIAFVEETTDILLSDEPGEIGSNIKYNIMFEKFNSPNLAKTIYDLEFAVQIEGIWNWDRLVKVLKMVDDYEKSLLEIYTQNAEEISEKIEELRTNVWRLFVSTLVYQSMFWIGAYLLFKGKDYFEFLERLWNIANPEEGHVTYVNQPAVPKDVTWSAVLLQKYYDTVEGPNFGTYQSAEPFMYKYFGLALLAARKGFHFPHRHELDPYFSDPRSIVLTKWSALLGKLRSPSFTEFLQNIDEKIDLDKFFGKQGMKNKLFSEIKKLQDGAEKAEIMIASLRPLDQKKIADFISKTRDEYNKDAPFDSICPIKRVHSATNLPKFYNSGLLSREAFQETGTFFVMDTLSHDVSRTIHQAERNYIIKKLQQDNTIKSVNIKMNDFVSQINSIYDQMQKTGCEPEIIFIPHFLKSEYQDRTKQPFSHGLTINGKTLLTVFSNDLKDNEIYFANKNCFDAVFLEQPTGLIQLSVKDYPQDPSKVIFEYDAQFNIDIINSRCIRRIKIKL